MKTIRIIISLILFLLAVSCSSHHTTLKKMSNGEFAIYAVEEPEAYKLAHSAMDHVFPGYHIDIISSPSRGFKIVFRFALDTYSQRITVTRVCGIEADTQEVYGYTFDVSGSGSSFAQGRQKNSDLYEELERLLEATGTRVSVNNVKTVAYIMPTAEFFAVASGDGGLDEREDVVDKLLELKKMKNSGEITAEEYRQAKKKLLN